MADTLGEFEQLVLAAILQLDEEAYAIRVRERIEDVADRRVTRGALYATLDRLAGKGFVEWHVGDSTPERGGIPRRRFRVTEDGVEAMRRSLDALRELTQGLEGVLGRVGAV